MKSSSLNRFSVATLALFSAAVALHPSVSEARPGIRGAAPTSISRPGGGGFAGRGGGAHAGQFANHGGGQFQGAKANTGQHANTSAQANQGQRFSGNSQVNGGNRAAANNSGNRTINNNGSRAVNNGNINTGNVNVANGNNVNVNVNDGGWGYWNDYHPVAAGVAIGTAAAVTTAAIGSMMYSLPPACSPRPYGGMTYYYCGGAWYAPQYQGDQVVYVVVNQPG